MHPPASASELVAHDLNELEISSRSVAAGRAGPGLLGIVLKRVLQHAVYGQLAG